MKNNILLIYPRLGPYDKVIRDMPLSLIYASRLVKESGFNVVIVDQRLENNWKDRIKDELSKQPLLIGISVMTGEPIKYALELSRFIKMHTDSPIIWGGIHPTIMPEQTICNEYIDIVVRGDGEETLMEIAKCLSCGNLDLSGIKGITFKNKGRIISNLERKRTDYFNSLPDYSLINVNDYIRFGGKEKYFSVFTSVGCPHHCAFCYNTSFDKNAWQLEEAGSTMRHLDLIFDQYRPECLSFIDSDFFGDRERVKNLFQEIKKRKWKIKIDFRGGRVDELIRIPDETFSLMQEIGVRYIQIGVESGSQRILDLMDKQIEVEDTIELNKRLKYFPKIRPAYNFFSGIPTETVEDIKMSANLIFRLLDDNPSSLISAFNHYTPYPGTKLFDLSVKFGLNPPEELEDWINFDESNFAMRAPWLDARTKSILNMAYISSFFIDTKIEDLFDRGKLKYRMTMMLSMLYRPLAKFRLRHLFARLLFEKYIINFLKIIGIPK